MGTRMAKLQAEMCKIRRALLPAMCAFADGSTMFPQLTNIDVARQPPGEWKKLIAIARQAVIDKMNGVGPEPAPENTSASSRSQSKHSSAQDSGVVAVVSKNDLSGTIGADGVPRSLQDAPTLLLHATIATFTLNTEQTRAFLLAAHHLHHHEPEQLLMHLGGMAGTGKSRVLQVLMTFLDNCGESYRFIVLGPTGSSAALVGGSTYHSVLGFSVGNDSGFAFTTSLEKV